MLTYEKEQAAFDRRVDQVKQRAMNATKTTSMNILFFDTETIGLPKNWKAPVTDVENWPRCFQLAYQVADSEGNLLEDKQTLIVPDGWQVPQEDFWIKHGHTTEKCIEQGIPMPIALNGFVNAIEKYDIQLMVAHNMDFDKNIIGAEMIRYDMKVERIVLKVCTMKSSISFCDLPGKYGPKFPRLDELHRKLFDCDFVGAHDAASDVDACRKCFFKLLELGVIKLPVKQES